MITIKFHGIELIVPPEEVGAVMRQLTGIAGALKQRAPGDTLLSEQQPEKESAITALNPASAWPFPPTSSARERRPLLSVSPTSGKYEDTALQFLRAIADHNLSGGLQVEQIMKLLGATHPKGVGSKMARINKIIEGFGFNVDDVYNNSRDSVGVRHWVSGPVLAKAIKALERRA